MIRLEKIKIQFGKKVVIENGELTLRRGQVTARTGPSGSGKTTLLYCLGLISSQTGHSYTFEGVSSGWRATGRRRGCGRHGSATSSRTTASLRR